MHGYGSEVAGSVGQGDARPRDGTPTLSIKSMPKTGRLYSCHPPSPSATDLSCSEGTGPHAEMSDTTVDTLPLLIADSSDEENDAAACDSETEDDLPALLSESDDDNYSTARRAQERRREKEAAKRRQIELERLAAEERKKERERMKEQRKQFEASRRQSIKAQEAATFTSTLVEGCSNYACGYWQRAALSFDWILKNWSVTHIASSCEVIPTRELIRYLRVSSLLSLDCMADSRMIHKDQVLDELNLLIREFPMPFVYYAYGRALNRYKPLQDDIENFLQKASLLCEARTCPTHILPGGHRLNESDMDKLSLLIQHELTVTRNRPPPDALCCSETCLKRRIYWSGFNNCLYVRIVCTDKHVAVYHKSCWRTVRKRVYALSRGDIVGEACPLSGCIGAIARHEDIAMDGSVRRAVKADEPSDRNIEPLCISPEDRPNPDIEYDYDEDEDGDERTEEVAVAAEEVEEQGTEAQTEVEQPGSARKQMTAYAIDLDSLEMIVPRTRQDGDYIQETKRRKPTCKVKQKKKQGRMSLKEFWRLEAQESARRYRAKQRASSGRQPCSAVETAVEDIRVNLDKLARKPVKLLPTLSQ